MPTKKELLNHLQNAGLHPNKLIMKKDGTVEYRRGYFYHHGMNTETVSNEIIKALPGAQIMERRDNFAQWPKDSYIAVRFKPPRF